MRTALASSRFATSQSQSQPSHGVVVACCCCFYFLPSPERQVERLRGIEHELDESVEFFLLERRRVMLRRRAKSAVYQVVCLCRERT